jgi:hypothetical protein
MKFKILNPERTANKKIYNYLIFIYFFGFKNLNPQNVRQKNPGETKQFDVDMAACVCPYIVKYHQWIGSLPTTVVTKKHYIFKNG